METCKICGSPSSLFSKKRVLNTYDAEYYRCGKCGFIQVKDPHWLHEAYEDAISPLDTGLVSRNLNLSKVTRDTLAKHFDPHKRFVDYGGGYGLFVRLMRDSGFDFYRQDPYCQNLFAQHFDITDLKDGATFELLTAFELFEHLEDPVTEVGRMLTLSDSILFSTELQPKSETALKDWWYFVPETGQHISFYTKGSLAVLAKKYDVNFYTNERNIHLLTRKTTRKYPFKVGKEGLIPRIKRKLSTLLVSSAGDRLRLQTLTQKDHDSIRDASKK